MFKSRFIFPVARKRIVDRRRPSQKFHLRQPGDGWGTTEEAFARDFKEPHVWHSGQEDGGVGGFGAGGDERGDAAADGDQDDHVQGEEGEW